MPLLISFRLGIKPRQSSPVLLTSKDIVDLFPTSFFVVKVSILTFIAAHSLQVDLAQRYFSIEPYIQPEP